MNRNLWLLALCQGLLLTNNIAFVAINGLVGLRLAPMAWMATLPVMGYVLGSALATPVVAWVQARWGRRIGFQTGLLVALLSTLLAAWAIDSQSFWGLVGATFIAGYYSANGQLYRFAAAELALPEARERAVSWVLAAGLFGAVVGPYLAVHSQQIWQVPFVGAYLALAAVALLSLLVMGRIEFAPERVRVVGAGGKDTGRSVWQLLREPVFFVACMAAALGYGVMNDGGHAAGHAAMWPGLWRDRHGFAMACDWHVCAGLFYRRFHQALGRATGHGGGRAAQCRLRRGGAQRGGRAPVQRGFIFTGRGLEFFVHRRHQPVFAGLCAA